jgi:phage shock protein A
MSLFKRLSFTLKSQLDEAVSRIENHDAIIHAALQESRDAIARLKLQHSRTRNRLQQIDDQRIQCREEEKNWLVRAKALAASDETQALACLERRDHCVEKAAQMRQQHEQYTDMESNLAQRIKRLEQRPQIRI